MPRSHDAAHGAAAHRGRARRPGLDDGRGAERRPRGRLTRGGADAPGGLTLRPATSTDARALWSIRTEAIRALCAGSYPAEDVARWAAAPMPPRFGEVLVRQRALVVTDGPLGERLAFGFLDRDDGQIAAVYVRPDRARRGVGRALLAALEDEARAAGLAALHLSSSLNAVPFYAAAGWVETGRTTFRHPEGFDLPSVRMDKRLSEGAASPFTWAASPRGSSGA